VVLTDQVKNLDWKKRRATYLTAAPAELLEEVLEKLLTLIDPSQE